jgi:hypothetical protein
MTYRAQRTKETLRHWRNFATGMLIGSAVWAPVYAATANDSIPSDWSARLAHGDWTTLLLVGSIVLLGIGVLLRIRAHDNTPRAQPAPDPQDSIGRYRPQIYRP